MGHNQPVTGEIPFGAPGTGRDLSSQTINMYLFNPAAQTPGTTYGDPRTELGPVRCDDGVPGEDDAAPPEPGCVLPTHVPTFVLNSPEFPSPPAPLHAAFVARAQSDPRMQGFGRPGSGRPLIREYLLTKEEREAKRERVCGDFERYPWPPGTPPPERDSCNEYPYSGPRRRGSTEAYVEHGHYFVMHADSVPPIGHYSDWDEGLMLYSPDESDGRGGVYVRTGTFYGPVAITVETYDSANQVVPPHGRWETTQEIDIVATGPNLRVETDGGVEIDLPQLHLAPGEKAGVRLHARGVEKAADVQEIRLRDGAIEHHLLQLWRA